jgi:cob(I)alamin adenosyltransferase
VKIYTKTGDAGDTGLFGGARVSKASERIATYGEVDELNSVLGRARLHAFGDQNDALLAAIQSQLFDLGAELASPTKSTGTAQVGDAEGEAMEQAIDRAETELAPLRTFVLPGGSPLAAELHVARTVCRRAERHVVALAAHEPVRVEVIRYLNRASDLFFVLARLANHRAGVADVPWVGRNTQKQT